jgi:hypothetical protein
MLTWSSDPAAAFYHLFPLCSTLDEFVVSLEVP